MQPTIQPAPRVKKRMPCDLFYNGTRHSGIVLNVSRSGLFVQTSLAARPGAHVSIDLSVPQQSSVALETTVVWKRFVESGLMSVGHGGVGLHIESAASDYYEFLEGIGSGPADSCRADAEPEQEPDGTRYRVRVKLAGSPRSRAITVIAPSDADARERALAKVGEGWSIIEFEEE